MGLGDLKAFGKHLAEIKGQVYGTEEYKHLMAKKPNFAPTEKPGNVCLCVASIFYGW